MGTPFVGGGGGEVCVIHCHTVAGGCIENFIHIKVSLYIEECCVYVSRLGIEWILRNYEQKLENSYLLDSILVVTGWIRTYKEKGVGYITYHEGKYLPVHKK